MGFESIPKPEPKVEEPAADADNRRKEEVEALVKQEGENIAGMKKLLANQENELQTWLDGHRGESGVQLDDAAQEELSKKRDYIEATKNNIEDAKQRIEKLRTEMLKDIKPA